MAEQTLFPPRAAPGALWAEYDTTGNYVFFPNSCALALTYDGSGNLATETYTCPVTTLAFRKTYTFTAGVMTATTGWVKQ